MVKSPVAAAALLIPPRFGQKTTSLSQPRGCDGRGWPTQPHKWGCSRSSSCLNHKNRLEDPSRYHHQQGPYMPTGLLQNHLGNFREEKRKGHRNFYFFSLPTWFWCTTGLLSRPKCKYEFLLLPIGGSLGSYALLLMLETVSHPSGELC